MINLIEKIKGIKGNQSAGIEMHLSGNGNLMANVVVMKRYRGTIQIKNTYFRLNSLEAIKNSIPESLPISLTIDGKGIIYKKVKLDSSKTLINHLLPNAPEKDFYVFKYPAEEENVYLNKFCVPLPVRINEVALW